MKEKRDRSLLHISVYFSVKNKRKLPATKHSDSKEDESSGASAAKPTGANATGSGGMPECWKVVGDIKMIPVGRRA